MGYRAYPQYQSSGDAWLGEVPSGWTVLRADFLCDPIKKQITEDKLSGLEVFHYSIPVVQKQGTGCIQNGDEIDSAKLLIDQPQLLVSKLNPRKATICLADKQKPLTVASGEFIQIASSKIDIKYAYYTWLNDKVTKLLSSRVQSVTRSHQRVAPEDIYKLNWAWPSRSEQKSIANFLDHKTAQIDRLIEKKQELIEKLQEQCIATTTDAVTKGLDSNAGMKDSGTEWLGRVPDHWDVNQLSLLTETIQTGPFGSQLHAADYVEGGIPLINPAHLVSGNIVPDEQSAVDTKTVERLSRHKLKLADIIMARRGEIGRCAFVGEEQAGWLCGTGSLIIRFAKGNSRFFSIVISSGGFSKSLELHAVGTTMLNLNPTIVGRMLVPVPPVAEQNQIVSYIDVATTKINRSLAKAREAIDRLQEYRTALITAAVTGQIDVRDWQAPVATEEPEADKEVA